MNPPPEPNASSSDRNPWGLIDPPKRSATLQKWEHHLQFLKSLPGNASLKEEMIATAEKRLEEKKLAAQR